MLGKQVTSAFQRNIVFLNNKMLENLPPFPSLDYSLAKIPEFCV